MKIDDQSIYRLLMEHDSRGMELMFNSYYRPLVLWADTFLNDMPTAEDIVQDFFLSFWENQSYLRITSNNFRGYIFVAVKNRALNALEKHDPLRNAVDLLPTELEDYLPEDLTEEMLQAVEAEIKRLPPRMREVLTAVYIDGLSYSETSEKLHISISTVKTLLVNALKKLREVFSHFLQKFL